MPTAADPRSDPEQERRTTRPRCDPTPAGRTGRRPVRRLMRRGLRTLGQLRRVPELAQLARDAAAAAGDIVLSPPDADTALRGMPSLPKSIAWSGPVPLEEIKTIGRRLGGTVNDVLLTALAGALQRYLQARQDDCRPTLVFVRSYPSTGARRAPRRNWAIKSRRCSSLCPSRSPIPQSASPNSSGGWMDSKTRCSQRWFSQPWRLSAGPHQQRLRWR